MPSAPTLKCRTTGRVKKEDQRVSSRSVFKRQTSFQGLPAKCDGLTQDKGQSDKMTRKNSAPKAANRPPQIKSNGSKANGHLNDDKHVSRSKSLRICRAGFLGFLAVIGAAIILNDIGYLPLKFVFQNHTLRELTAEFRNSFSLNQIKSLLLKQKILAFDKWRDADEETLKLYWTDLCNIDRKFIDEISTEKFKKEYWLKKPLLIKFRNGASDWTVPEKWTLGSLQKEYGDWMLFSGNSLELVRQGGNGYVGSSFADYVDSVMSKKSQDEKLYVFDRNFYQDTDLPNTLRVPSYLSTDPATDESLFFLGSSGTGISFHNHADAWNAVVFGHKRWFLYRIDQNPPGGVYPGFTQLDWFHRVYPNLTDKEKPVECIQKPGEILYLPEGLYHGTMNIGDTVAVGVQKISAVTDSMKNIYKENELREEGEMTVLERMNLVQQVLDTYPESAEMNMRLGALYDMTNQLQEAESHCERAIQLDPYFIMAYLTLGEVKAKLEKYGEAEVLLKKVMSLNPRLWDVYAKYGMFLKARGRFQEAAHIFRQGIELDASQTPFYYYLHEVELELGNIAAAQDVQDRLKQIQAAMEGETTLG